MRYIILLISLIFILPQKISAKDQLQIIWKNFNYPPMSISHGPLQDQGYTDLMQKYLINNLKNYQHVREVSIIQRTIKEMKTNRVVCNTSLLKTTQRLDYIAFSDPAYLIHPVGAIVASEKRKEFETYINKDNILDFDQVIASGQFNIAIMEHRAYGKDIQTILDLHQKSPNLQRYKNSLQSNMLYKLLLHGSRVDLILGYPVELVYLARKLDASLNKYTFLPISSHEYMMEGYIGCTKSYQGTEIIKKINKILNNGGKELAITEYIKWLDPETKAAYLKYIEQFISINNK